MQPSSLSTFQPRPPPNEAIPYSSAALRQDLQRVRDIWDDCQATRDRDAIYGYLTAVYGLVAVWNAEGREVERARRALRLRLAVADREDPFAAIIRCTADPAKADKRTRSKWSRVMRFAAAHKPDSEPLDQFIRRKGRINACAGRFSGTRGEVGQRGLRDGCREDHEQIDGQIIRSRWGSPGLPMRRNFAPEKQGDQGPLRKKGFAFKRVTRRRPCHN
jgi:hypothetical protein